MREAREELLQAADGLQKRLTDLSDDIFRNPELGLKEEKTSAKMQALLKEAGFKIEPGIAGMPAISIFMVISHSSSVPWPNAAGEANAMGRTRRPAFLTIPPPRHPATGSRLFTTCPSLPRVRNPKEASRTLRHSQPG